MPGHMQGRGAPEDLRALMGVLALAADTTQVLDLDDIHRPRTALKSAQDLAAQAWGADRTWFLVNGSSCGNMAMILATVGPGQEILVPRAAHRSVHGALVLSGARPVYLESPWDDEMGVHHPVEPEALARTLDAHPAARAVFFTSVTPYGAAALVEDLVDLGRERDLPVLVDEAWGPHLAFHPDLPHSALEAGADLVVHSVHKLLSALSQASMLHQSGQRIEPARVEVALRMLQSTSPNCLLVASLDSARRQVALQGRRDWQHALDLSDAAREALARVPGLRCAGPERCARYDRTRLVVSALDLGYTGVDLERLLRDREGIQVEMSDVRNIVVMVTPGHQSQDLERLVTALGRLPRRAGPARIPDLTATFPTPEQAMTPREAFYASTCVVPISQAPGRICAEFLTPYPPGIPLLCPGEVFCAGHVDHLARALAAGIPLEGPADPTLQTVRVVADER